MIVLDASLAIAYLDREDAHHASATELLAREIDDDFVIGTITLAEVLVGPARTGRLGAVFAALRDLEVAEEPLAPAAALQLAELRATTGLKLPDCSVLLTTEHRRARLATFDGRLARAAVERGLTALTA